MVAPAEHNERPIGTFGEPLRLSAGISFTRRELRAIRRAANYGSVSKVVRDLIPRDAMEQLIHETEAEAASASRN